MSARAARSAAPAVLREGLKRHPPYSEELGLFALAIVVFLAGLVPAYRVYGKNAVPAAALEPLLGFLRRVLHRKWFVDELYERLVIHPFYWLCDAFNAFDKWVVDGAVNGTARATLWLSYLKAGFDRWVVDLLVNGCGWFVRWAGAGLRRLQTGYLQSYAAALLVGAFALLVVYMLFAL